MKEKRPKRNVLFQCVLSVALSCFALNSLLAVPETPSIERTVTEIEGDGPASLPGSNATMVRPHIPVLHTTGDGRVGVDMKPFTNSGKVEFYLYVPEQLDGLFIDGPVGTTGSLVEKGILWDQKVEIDMNDFVDEIIWSDDVVPVEGEIRHVTIIDKTREFVDDPSYQNNPSDDSGVDLYKLDIYATVDWRGKTFDDPDFVDDPADPDDVPDKILSTRDGYLKMQVTPIEVRVSNPKTENAAIASIVLNPAGSEKDESFNYIRVPRLFENKFTNDGKLMVARIGFGRAGDPYEYWRPDQPDAASPTGSVEFMDVVYAYSSDGSLDGVTGDNRDGFDNLIPISYAPYDPRINGQYLNDTDQNNGGEFYPFAAFPFRDGSGTLVPPGDDFGGSYPWIDSDGRTLAMSTVRGTLNHNNANPRYPNVPFDPTLGNNTTQEDAGPFQNQSLVGLWTQGKLVTMDNSLNNTDFGINKEPRHHRIVDLYTSVTGLVPTDGKMRVGSGRGNTNIQDFGVAGNTTFFDSIENKLNFEENLRPVMPRDVVWWVSNGKSTAQFAFDDYLNKNSFIVSKMNGALERDSTRNNPNNRFLYYDGWNDVNDEFSERVRLANDASAIGDAVATEMNNNIDARSGIIPRWNIPAYGLVGPEPSDPPSPANDPRLEPIAHGGIEGKGMWLDTHMSITYAIPAQPSGVVVGNHGWYVGIFVDSRVDDTTERRLITFPDGTSISLEGRDTLNYRNSSSTLIHTIDLTQFDTWSRNEWRHLAFQISAGGETVEFYHNGMLADIGNWTSGALFQMTVGDLIVGATSGTNGYRGWFDDFKVFGETFGPEVSANLARGTLVAVDTDDVNYSASMLARADLYVEMGENEGMGEKFIRDQLYHSGQETHGLNYRYAVHYDYTDHDGAHLGNIPTGAISIREDLIFPEAPLFYNVHRPDSIDMTLVNGENEINGAFSNSFCLSCHDDSNPVIGMKLAALELNSNLLASGDPRRQPIQALRRVFGHIPENWIGTHATLDAGTNGILIDRYILDNQGAGSRTVHTLSLLDENDDIIEGLESGDLIFDNFGYGYQVRANLDAAQGSVRFTFTEASDPTNPVSVDVDEAPYVADLPGIGNYEVKAEPFTYFPGSGNTVTGMARTVTDIVRTGVPIGQIIALKSADEGLYVNVDTTQGDRLEANVSTLSGSGQYFEVVDAGGGFVALKSVLNGNYIDVNTTSTTKIINASLDPAVDPVPTTAQFTWIAVDSDTVRLRNAEEGNDVDHIGAEEVLRARFQNSTSTSYRWDWELVD